jgi:hypothetical protein
LCDQTSNGTEIKQNGIELNTADVENGKSYLKYVAILHEEKLLTQSIQRKKHIKIFLPYA